MKELKIIQEKEELNVKVGDGATISWYSDKTPVTIIEIGKNYIKVNEIVKNIIRLEQLQQENQELKEQNKKEFADYIKFKKEQHDEYLEKINKLIKEKQELKTQLEDMTLCRDIASGHRQEVQDREVILLTQQKEFIKYLEDKIKYFKDLEQYAIKIFNNKAVINLDLVKRSIEEDNLLICNFEEILQKYKSIIGAKSTRIKSDT